MKKNSPAAEIYESLKFMGVENDDLKELFYLLVENKQYLEEFFRNFYNGNAVESILKYHSYRKKMTRINKQQFISMINKGEVVEALKRLFLEPLSQEDVNWIRFKNVSYVKIYELAKRHPDRWYKDIILHQSYDEEEHGDSFLIEECSEKINTRL